MGTSSLRVMRVMASVALVLGAFLGYMAAPSLGETHDPPQAQSWVTFPVGQVQRLDGVSSASVAVRVDAEGHTFYAAQVNNGYDAWVEVWELTGTGQAAGHWRGDPVDGGGGANKVDSVALSSSGDDLVVSMTSHWVNQPRPYFISTGIIDGVYAPYQVEPEGGAGAYNPAGVATDADVEAAVRRVLGIPTGTLVDAFGGDIRQGIEDKAKDAALELFDPSFGADPRTAGYRYHWYTFTRDRVYEVLRENGVIPHECQP